MNSFYNTDANVQHGTSTYIAKAILNHLLDGDVHMHHDSRCTVSWVFSMTLIQHDTHSMTLTCFTKANLSQAPTEWWRVYVSWQLLHCVMNIQHDTHTTWHQTSVHHQGHLLLPVSWWYTHASRQPLYIVINIQQEITPEHLLSMTDAIGASEHTNIENCRIWSNFITDIQ